MIIGYDTFFKFLNTEKLINLLQTLPEGSVVSPNQVGNLAIYTIQGEEFTFIGYVAFLHEGEIEYI